MQTIFPSQTPYLNKEPETHPTRCDGVSEVAMGLSWCVSLSWLWGWDGVSLRWLWAEVLCHWGGHGLRCLSGSWWLTVSLCLCAGSSRRPTAKYTKVGERLRHVIPGHVQCSVACGGRACKYENPTRWAQHEQAITGLYSSWWAAPLCTTAGLSKTSCLV